MMRALPPNRSCTNQGMNCRKRNGDDMKPKKSGCPKCKSVCGVPGCQVCAGKELCAKCRRRKP